MKERILFFLSFITHPIFLPLVVLLLLTNIPISLYLLLICLIFPVVLLKLAGIDLKSPDLAERRLIFVALALSYLSASAIWQSDMIIKLFYMAWFFGMIVLAFCSFRIKVSWHALGWGILATFLLLVLWSIKGYIKYLGPLEAMVVGVLVFGGLPVMFLRYVQKAHTLKELLLGYAIGLSIPGLLYFLCT
ncbi:hypothetical protein GYB22_00510 [bacterium]|nr:hypothetical protein [bacterium]